MKLKFVDWDSHPRVVMFVVVAGASLAWLVCATALLDPTQVLHPDLVRLARTLLSMATYVDEESQSHIGPSGVMALGVVLFVDIGIAAGLLRDEHVLKAALSPPRSVIIMVLILIWVVTGIVLPLTAAKDGTATCLLAFLSVTAIVIVRALSYSPPRRARSIVNHN